jgi:hypothetical protein
LNERGRLQPEGTKEGTCIPLPSQFTVVTLIKLKRTQTVCVEKERKRERKREKTERKQSFFSFFAKNKLPPKNKKIKKML